MLRACHARAGRPGVATHRRRLSARRTLTREESGRSPTRTAQSKPSLRCPPPGRRLSDIAHLGCCARKRGTSGATWRRPKPAGAVMRRCPLALTPTGADAGLGIGQVGQQALAVFQKGAALVRERDAARGAHQQLDAQALFQRVEPPADDGRRHPFGRAAAVRLPLVATETKDSICLSFRVSRPSGRSIGARPPVALQVRVVKQVLRVGDGGKRQALLLEHGCDSSAEAGPPVAGAAAGSASRGPAPGRCCWHMRGSAARSA
jgi:hypothetical protein